MHVTYRRGTGRSQEAEIWYRRVIGHGGCQEHKTFRGHWRSLYLVTMAYICYFWANESTLGAEIWYRGYLDMINVMTVKSAASEVTEGHFI